MKIRLEDILHLNMPETNARKKKSAQINTRKKFSY